MPHKDCSYWFIRVPVEAVAGIWAASVLMSEEG